MSEIVFSVPSEVVVPLPSGDFVAGFVVAVFVLAAYSFAAVLKQHWDTFDNDFVPFDFPVNFLAFVSLFSLYVFLFPSILWDASQEYLKSKYKSDEEREELREKLQELRERVDDIARGGEDDNVVKMMYEVKGRADGLEFALGERDEL